MADKKKDAKVPTTVSGKTSTPTPRREAATARGQKVGNASPRVSENPAGRKGEGPTAKDVQSKKKSTDTRGSKSSPSAAKGEHPRPRPAEEQIPTAAETAAKQPLRQSDHIAPAETIKVKGATVEVVAEPTNVDPVELTPMRRDTLIKDALRLKGEPEKADAPARRDEGGQWQLEDPKLK